MKTEILLFTFPILDNAWNLLKKWEKPGILTQNLEKKVKFVYSVFHSKFTFQDI